MSASRWAKGIIREGKIPHATFGHMTIAYCPLLDFWYSAAVLQKGQGRT